MRQWLWDHGYRRTGNAISHVLWWTFQAQEPIRRVKERRQRRRGYDALLADAERQELGRKLGGTTPPLGPGWNGSHITSYYESRDR